MQIEPLGDINFLSDWQKFKFNITPCWQSMGKSLFNRWEYKLIQSLHSDLAITIKITNAHTIWLTISLLGIYPTGVHTPMDEMSMIKIIHYSITCYCKRLEIIQVSEQVKLILVQPYHRILCSYKKKLWSCLCAEMKWSPRYTNNKRARCRTMIIVSIG